MPNTLRIIGGEWRGRRIRFPGVAGIRPTPDRVRETLFNWLMAQVAGSRCLDLFAGSGALGLEALSRGAAAVTFVERDREAARGLRETAAKLAPERATVVESDALSWLAGPASEFDVAFLDPPFESGALAQALAALDSRGWLAGEASIYVEMPAAAGAPMLPAGWRLHRSGRAGAVGYHLARRAGGEGEAN
jgi:16S rRNA (guanine966-N2)-methyltransferase